MHPEKIQFSFKSTINKAVRVIPEGDNRYQIFTPFHFDDGDHFVIILKRDDKGKWIITDEGHTYMHMSYKIDLSSLAHGARNAIIERALEKYGVEEQEGQIFTRIDDFTNAGNIFYNFVQCLINITDVSYLSRKRSVSVFMEDFKKLISEAIDPERIQFNYQDKKRDSKKEYLVDCYVSGMHRPLHIYAISNGDKCRDATIKILKFREWKLPFSTLGVFKDREKINRKVLSRFAEVCDYQFSSLAANQEKITGYLQSQLDSAQLKSATHKRMRQN